MVWLGHDVDDGEDVDVAAGGDVFTTDDSGTDGDKVLALVGVL